MSGLLVPLGGLFLGGGVLGQRQQLERVVSASSNLTGLPARQLRLADAGAAGDLRLRERLAQAAEDF